VGGLFTNFHLPSFVVAELRVGVRGTRTGDGGVRRGCARAVRFYSYGDAMRSCNIPKVPVSGRIVVGALPGQAHSVTSGVSDCEDQHAVTFNLHAQPGAQLERTQRPRSAGWRATRVWPCRCCSRGAARDGASPPIPRSLSSSCQTWWPRPGAGVPCPRDGELGVQRADRLHLDHPGGRGQTGHGRRYATPS